MQEAALPYRVVRSAKDLACATLSGTFELNDLQGSSKQTGTLTQTSRNGEDQSSSLTRSRPVLSSRGSSFRNGVSTTLCRDTEEDFDRFQALDDFQGCQHPGFIESLASLRDADVSQGDHVQYISQDISHTPLDSVFDTIAKDHVTSTSGTDQSNSAQSDSATGVANDIVHERNLDHASASALRRLHQIGAHLQQNLAMQMLQQNAYEQSHVSMQEVASHVQNAHHQQAISEHHSATSLDKSRSGPNGYQGRTSSQHQKSMEPAQRNPASSSSEEEDGLQRQFHCPYYACHRNLQSSSTSGSSHRLCVHVGCEFQADTFDSWAEHIHVPHHDLLGSS